MMAKTLLWIVVIALMIINPTLSYLAGNTPSISGTNKTVMWLTLCVLAVCEAIETIGKRVKQ